jgi:hypothetical protein
MIERAACEVLALWGAPGIILSGSRRRTRSPTDAGLFNRERSPCITGNAEARIVLVEQQGFVAGRDLWSRGPGVDGERNRQPHRSNCHNQAE